VSAMLHILLLRHFLRVDCFRFTHDISRYSGHATGLVLRSKDVSEDAY
jgi:hypothetical protein